MKGRRAGGEGVGVGRGEVHISGESVWDEWGRGAEEGLDWR